MRISGVNSAEAVIRQLQSRDSVVRAHEAAHIAAGGGVVTGGAHYSFQKGPDGREYAVGGEVGIDLSPVSGNSRATIAKMETVRAAALAPAEPSAQDQSVAAAAAQAEVRAQVEAYRKSQKKQAPEPGSLVDLIA
jgi:hypothetical protein